MSRPRALSARRAGGEPGGTARHLAAVLLAALGTVLLAVTVAIELAKADSRVQLGVGAGGGVAYLLALAAVRGADSRARLIRFRLLTGAGLAALLAVLGLYQATERTGPSLLLLAPVGLLFVIAALQYHEAATSGRQARLGELRSRLAGEEAERRRWVQEVHDDTLQALAAIDVLLATAMASANDEVRAKRIAEARSMVTGQIRTLRRLISRMRPLTLDTLGLAPALEELARRTADTTGIAVRADIGPLPRLPAAVETGAYRVVQAALANAVRHSGAERITIEARPDAGALEVAVRDNGRGLLAGRDHRPGYGMIGMRERADAIGARLTVTSREGEGTRVGLRIPLEDPGRPPAIE
jgi:two-component system sensor histidine kinase UhpB